MSLIVRSYRLPGPLLTRLELEAARRGQNNSEFVRDAVSAALPSIGTPEDVTPKKCRCGEYGEWSGQKCPSCAAPSFTGG